MARATIARAALAIGLCALPTRAQEPIDSVPPTDSVLPTDPRPFRVCAGGDVTLGTNLDTAWARMAARRMWSQFAQSDDPATLVAPLRELFAGADIVLLNVEGAIGSGRASSKCGKRSKNCYAFRSPASAAPALRSVGDSAAVVVGNVANNHARDAGDIGVDSTIAHLTRAGVRVTGADSLATVVTLPDSTVVAILGFYTTDIVTDARNIDAVRRYVAGAVSQYGTVIVTAHIGAEGPGAQRTGDSTEYFLESRIDRGNPVAFANASAFTRGCTEPRALRLALAVSGRVPRISVTQRHRLDDVLIRTLVPTMRAVVDGHREASPFSVAVRRVAAGLRDRSTWRGRPR